MAPLRKPTVSLESTDEFPTLGATKPNNVVPSKRFAELSKDWAKTQKEDDQRAKEEKQQEARRIQLEQQARERTAKDEREMRKAGMFHIPSLTKKYEEYETKRHYEEEEEEEPIEELEEEEEEDEEEDGTWRKHRDDLY